MGALRPTLDLIREVAAHAPNIGALCFEIGLNPINTCDLVALSAAESYLHGAITWDIGDSAMVHLFDWAYRDGGPGLSNFAWLVYCAFTLGESRHSGQPENSGAEYFSMPLLRLACSRSPDLPLPMLQWSIGSKRVD